MDNGIGLLHGYDYGPGHRDELHDKAKYFSYRGAIFILQIPENTLKAELEVLRKNGDSTYDATEDLTREFVSLLHKKCSLYAMLKKKDKLAT